MKLARSLAHGIAGIILLIFIIAAGIVAVDERLSKQLDAVDPTNEEMVQNVKLGGEQ